MSCTVKDITPPQTCSEILPGGYVWAGGSVDQCPGTTPTPGRTTPDIQFVPNVPIPDLFEGEIAVDGTLLARYLRAFYVYFVWVVGILATVMVMYAGIQWITAAGNSSKIENAKSTMNGAFIGLVLTLASFVVLRAINPTLVSFQDLSIFSVPRILSLESNERSERGSPPEGLPPNVSDVQNVSTWDDQIQTIAAEYGLDPFYVKAMMLIESGGNADIRNSEAGACGLMQVMPFNSNNVCLRGTANAEANLRAGMNYIKNTLFKHTCPDQARYRNGDYVSCTPSQTSCTSNWHYVIAAYNGGPGSNCSSRDCTGKTWWECEANPGFSETRNYVEKVEAMERQVRNWGWALKKTVTPVETCDNGTDDDGDGDVDCADSDCADSPSCVTCTPVAEICTDAVDNDCDTKTDCADPDCVGNPACPASPSPEICTNGIDDDLDGMRDCADPDCVLDLACMVPPGSGDGVLCEEDFEHGISIGTAPCNWYKSWAAWKYAWNPVTCNPPPSGGSHSAWVAAGFADGEIGGLDPCTTPYHELMDTNLLAGPFDLSDADGAYLEFDYWVRTEPVQDFLSVSYTYDLTQFYDTRYHGDLGPVWRTLHIDMQEAAGKPRMWVRFRFRSDSSVSFDSIPDGVFIDNIKIVKSTPSSEVCTNGIDDDGDGQIDCNDDDCSDAPACNQPFQLTDLVVPLSRIEEHAFTIKWKTTTPASTNIDIPGVGTYAHPELVTDHIWNSADDGAVLDANTQYTVTVASTDASGRGGSRGAMFVTDFTDVNGIRWEGFTDMPTVTWNGSTNAQVGGCTASKCNQLYSCNADGLADCSDSAGHNYMSTTCGALARADCVDGEKDLPSGFSMPSFDIMSWAGTVLPLGNADYLPACSSATPPYAISGPVWTRTRYPGDPWLEDVLAYGADSAGAVGCTKTTRILPSISTIKFRVIWKDR